MTREQLQKAGSDLYRTTYKQAMKGDKEAQTELYLMESEITILKVRDRVTGESFVTMYVFSPLLKTLMLIQSQRKR